MSLTSRRALRKGLITFLVILVPLITLKFLFNPFPFSDTKPGM